MKLLALSGSTRRDSWNTRLLHAAAAAAPARAEVAWAPDLSALPHFGEDIEAQAFASGPVAAFVAAVHAADALLVATPEYNQSIPGTLKNALDGIVTSRTRVAVVVEPDDGAEGARYLGMLTLDELAEGVTR